MPDLLHWRSEFPILASTTYMISHSLGAMPRRTYARMHEYAETWATRGIRAWAEGWWDMPFTVGDLIGQIVGAGPGEVGMQQNVSISQTIVTSCFDWSGPRNGLLTDGLNFPSNDYHYHALARQGARIVTVPAEGLEVPLERLLDAIDESIQLVSVSHVAFRTSSILDLKAVVEKAHSVGAMVIADLYQSAGAIPVDVRALRVDFATGGSVKWLCGGPGAGYLYVRRDLWDRLQPASTGWMAHEEPFAFAPAPIRYAPNAYRFMTGTPNIPALYAARSGYEIILEIGVDAIRENSQKQTQRLIELADAAGLKVNCVRDPARRGGTVTLDVPDGKRMVEQLGERGVLADYRPGAGIRIAPHFYTTDAEIERTVAEITSLASAR
jgi:kynureninase